MSVFSGSSSPRRIIIKWQTLVTVRSCGEVFAFAHSSSAAVHSRRRGALRGMPVALAPGAHRHIRDGVEIWLQHLRIAEYFVAEGVQIVQRYTETCRCYPFLKGTEKEYNVDKTIFLILDNAVLGKKKIIYCTDFAGKNVGYESSIAGA